MWIVRPLRWVAKHPHCTLLQVIAICYLFFAVTVATSNETNGRFRSAAQFLNKTISHGEYVSTSSFKSVSQRELAQARQLVQDALKRFSISNKNRFDTPLRNNHKYPAKFNRLVSTIQITHEMRRAAALVAEIDAISENSDVRYYGNHSAPEIATNANAESAFWMEGLTHLGTQPYGNDAGYKVSRS
jgi:hypothetical protein